MNIHDFPKLNKNPEVSKNIMKMSRIENMLEYMGYGVNTGKDVVNAIEQNHLDLSQFDFPYGSFEAFKEHALVGEFDFDSDNWKASSEQIVEIRQKVKDKKLWVRY